MDPMLREMTLLYAWAMASPSDLFHKGLRRVTVAIGLRLCMRKWEIAAVNQHNRGG